MVPFLRSRHLITYIAILIILGCSTVPKPNMTSEFSQDDFKSLLNTLAEGWFEGDAQKAVNCFTDDVIYIDPPDKQVHQGHTALYKFFGGDDGRAGQMKMTWHHLVFDESQQIGMGEFTFEFGTKAHGIVIVKIKDKKISHWREYWYDSELQWKVFIGESVF